jgi:hypothetical protein
MRVPHVPVVGTWADQLSRPHFSQTINHEERLAGPGLSFVPKTNEGAPCPCCWGVGGSTLPSSFFANNQPRGELPSSSNGRAAHIRQSSHRYGCPRPALSEAEGSIFWNMGSPSLHKRKVKPRSIQYPTSKSGMRLNRPHKANSAAATEVVWGRPFFRVPKTRPCASAPPWWNCYAGRAPICWRRCSRSG